MPQAIHQPRHRRTLLNRAYQKLVHEGASGVAQATLRYGQRQWRLLRQPAYPPVKAAVELLLEENRPIHVVQLGAYVGNSNNDPLFSLLRHRLQQGDSCLIAVEPVRAHFQQLCENYEGIPGVHLVNAAISDHAGTATFYRLGVDPVQYGFPEWVAQLGSLKQSRMRELWEGFENERNIQAFYLEHLVEDQVQCLTLNDLVQEHDLDRIDLLQLDVEGYEYEILKAPDYPEIPIRFVNYESVLLQQNKHATKRLMRRRGYHCIDHHLDTFCWKREDRHLPGRWKHKPLTPSAPNT